MVLQSFQSLSGEKRTSREHPIWSLLDPYRHFASISCYIAKDSFDHLVGAQQARNITAKIGGL